ncbi:uncharacterized protein LOC112263968 isoform X1 [Oncorhynchus tshawytscha]|uniref:uncharacterized protein LOC112263968 isoform X1 n=1 Tax=Oncorhynchus tshawytscha TaxID=74940 RepID=UPI000D0984FD|nr:uncharacterized protein LOC112263968 isoform X1 [Oncorhynchus tshawytscha]
MTVLLARHLPRPSQGPALSGGRPATSPTVPSGARGPSWTLHNASACCVGQGSRAAVSAPVSAVGKGWAAGWAPQRRHAAWRRTTCPPPVRQEGDPVDLKKDAALHQASVVTQRAAVRTNPVWQRRKATIKSANQRAAMTPSSGSFTWLATPLLIESTNELPMMPGFHGGHLRDWLLGFVVQGNLVVVH